MARTPDNLAFAERLKLALTRSAKRITTPSELALQFNLAYAGAPITNQAAQHWLVGDNMPSPDKITTLAQMLNVPSQWLRFGIAERRIAPKMDAKNVESITPDETEQALLRQFRKLSAHQRELLAGLVEQLVLGGEFWEN